MNKGVENLKGKTAVITGGAGGLGMAFARRFGREGMNLMIADVGAGPLAEAEATLAGEGFNVASFVIDVRDLKQIRALEKATNERFGNVHLLCNNAGVAPACMITEGDDFDAWHWTVDVNMWGVIYGCKIFLPGMMAHGEGGHVINTASMAGHIANGFMGAYNVSKFGVVGFSETMFRELEMTDPSIGVSVLCPAFVKTGISKSERSVPEDVVLPEETESVAVIRAIMSDLVDSGIQPEVVADAVADAVANKKFWILTHPEMNEAVTIRADEIVNGRNPSPIEL